MFALQLGSFRFFMLLSHALKPITSCIPYYSKADLFLLLSLCTIQLPSDGQAGQHTGPSRVAAVGPYIQSSTMPRGPVRQDPLVKPAYPDGTATLPAQDLRSQPGAGK